MKSNSILYKFMKTTLPLLVVALSSHYALLQAQTGLPPNHYKFKTANQVFQRVNDSFGSYHGPISLDIIPHSNSKTNPGVIARYRHQDGKIIISEALYDLCRTFRRDSLNALAVLLGHELAHHHRQHQWTQTYDPSTNHSNLSVDRRQAEEKEADFYGCYAAHIAGYNPAVFGNIIEAVYRRFDIRDQPDYPTLAFRRKTYQERSQMLQQLITTFQAGQYLYALREFEQAELCFKAISKEFVSAEILNNQAACKLQIYLKGCDHKVKKFIYPIEFDVSTRLSEGSRGRGVQDIQEAIALLEQSLKLRQGYEPTRINLACAYLLMKKYKMAIAQIGEITPLSSNAYTIRAIAYFEDVEDRQIQRAEADFEQAAKQGGYIGHYNRVMFRKLSSPIDYTLDRIQDWCSELLFSSKPAIRIVESENLQKVILKNAPILKYAVYPFQLVAGIVEQGMVEITLKNKIYVVQSSYRGMTKQGIRIGSGDAQLFQKYGRPADTVHLPRQDHLYIYYAKNKQKIIFLSQDKKITQWAVCLLP